MYKFKILIVCSYVFGEIECFVSFMFLWVKKYICIFSTRIILNEAEIQVEKKYVTLKLFFSQNKINK